MQRKSDHGGPSKAMNLGGEHAIADFGTGRPLDAAARKFFESRFGTDFSNVRVHTDRRAADSAQSIDALAYTLGRDLVFAPGQYAPGTDEGRRLIAHELAHVLQQKEMIVQRYSAGEKTSPLGSCEGWENDPESFSIHVARHFVRTEVDPALADNPVSVTCHNDHDCIVDFGDGLSIDVFWAKSTRRVGAGRSTDQGRQFCAYGYSCDPTGQLLLSSIKCYGPPKPTP